MFYFTTELLDFSDDILIASFDILHIHDRSLSTSDHPSEYHRDSCPEIP